MPSDRAVALFKEVKDGGLKEDGGSGGGEK